MIWKEKYRVGVELIDQQHKELFGRLSKFIETVQNDMPWEEKIGRVKETMIFVQEYMVTHFDEEEEYQKQIKYPHIEEHKIAHFKLKKEIRDYIESFEEEGFTEEKIQEFSGKLMAWLIMHVGHMDQKIGEFVRSKE